MMAAILNSTVVGLRKLLSFILTQLDDGRHLEFCHCWIQKTAVNYSDSTSWWQSSWILPCWIQTPCFLLSDSLKNTLTALWLWFKLIQSDSNSFILTQLDDGNHLEFGHHGFGHLIFSSQTHSHLPGLVPTICTKKTTLTFPFPPFAQKILYSFILTQFDDGSHLEFYHVGFRHLVFFSDSLKNTLTPLWLLTQTNSIWLKLIHSHSTWWWQPWILPSWIWPSWIQPP